MIPQEDDMDDYYTKTKHSLANHNKVLIRHNINSFINKIELDI